MADPSLSRDNRRNSILDAAITVFGRLGFRKTSVEDLAQSAYISKQGMYLHFASKEEIFIAAMQKYLDDGVALVDSALKKAGAPLHERLVDAMDAWFGRHLITFTPQSLDVIEAGNSLSPHTSGEYFEAFRKRIARAIAGSAEFRKSGNVGTAREIAEVLSLCGLTWKEGQLSRAEFRARLSLCVRVVCQLDAKESH
jgi:TetR/AcrR family transcriptional regulator, regulator of autoinduction and epiphytic fitness